MTSQGNKISKSNLRIFVDSPFLVREARQFLKDMKDESHRGTALIAAEYLNEILEEFLRAYFVDDADSVKSLFADHCLLESLCSKTRIAYSIGLLPENVFKDLNCIRRIRNKFAHSYTALTFDSPKIGNWCLELTWPGDLSKICEGLGCDSNFPNKDRFIMSVVLISNELLKRASKLSHVSPAEQRELSLLPGPKQERDS